MERSRWRGEVSRHGRQGERLHRRVDDHLLNLSWTPTGAQRLDKLDGPYRWYVEALGKDGLLDVNSDHRQPVDVRPDRRRAGRRWSLRVDADEPRLRAKHPLAVPHLGALVRRWQPGRLLQDRSPLSAQPLKQLEDKFPYNAGTDDDPLHQGRRLPVASVRVRHQRHVSRQRPFGYFTIDPPLPVTGQTVTLTGQGLESEETSCSKTLGPSPTSAEICSNLQQTPVLSWDRVPGAAYYMVYLFNDRELTNVVDDDPTSMMTANNKWTFSDLVADSQAGTAYYWFVRPCVSTNNCAPEPTKATNAFDKRSNPITGLEEQQHESTETLPGHGAAGSNDAPEFEDEVVLSWDDYLETNQAGNRHRRHGLALHARGAFLQRADRARSELHGQHHRQGDRPRSDQLLAVD